MTTAGAGATAESVINRELGSVPQYVEEREQREDRDILSGLREMDGAATITWGIHRFGEVDDTRNGWILDLPPEMLTIQTIAAKCGPGQYRVEGKYSNGQYAARRTVRIADDAVNAKRAGVGSSGVSGSGAGGGYDWREYEAREDARRERARVQRNELLALLVPAIAPIGAALIGAFAGRSGPDLATLITALKPPPPPDPLAMLVQLKALNAPAEAAGNPLENALSMMERLQSITGSGGNETSGMDILKELVRAVGPRVGGMIEAAMLAQAGGAAGGMSVTTVSTPALPPGAQPLQANQESEATSGGADAMMLDLLPWATKNLGLLIGYARRGLDPQMYADWLYNEIPDTWDDAKVAQLAQLLQHPQWFELLCKFQPGCAEHREWFTRMRAHLVRVFADLNAAPGTEPAPAPRPAPVEPDMPAAPPSLMGTPQK